MSANKHDVWPGAIKLIVLFIIGFFLWLFNNPFITPLLLGFIFAALTFPLYAWISKQLNRFLTFKKDWNTLAAMLTILIVCSVLITFGNVFIRQLIREIPNFSKEGLEFLQGAPDNRTVLNIAGQLGFSREDVQTAVNGFDNEVRQISSYFDPQAPQSDTRNANQIFSTENLNRALGIGTQLFGAIFNQLVYLVIFILAWLNALLLGQRWLNNIFQILPLSDTEVKVIKKDLTLGIRNVVYANLISGLIHAGVVFLIMLVFGLPNLFIVTLLVFLIGVLPLTPSELAYAIPILLLFQRNPWAATLLIPVAELIVLWVNYVVVPKVIAANGEGNDLLILTSILSGIAIFGLMGFLIGPVIMIFVQTLYRILRERLLGQPAENNSGVVTK
jgi:predicted PurR-regulated permease PerM